MYMRVRTNRSSKAIIQSAFVREIEEQVYTSRVNIFEKCKNYLIFFSLKNFQFYFKQLKINIKKKNL